MFEIEEKRDGENGGRAPSCMPATSVPCERVFSKAAEVVTKNRNSAVF